MSETQSPGAPSEGRVEIDLGGLRANFESVRRRVAPAGVVAVVKADAYGHGATRVSRCLEQAGIEWLAVARLEEARELRAGGIRCKILLLDAVSPEVVSRVRELDLALVLSSRAQTAAWAQAFARPSGTPLPVHLKVDTGLTRMGLDPDELPWALAAVRRASGLVLTGLASHLAVSEELEHPANAEQERRFTTLTEQLTALERRGVLRHLANSAAALYREPSRHHLVRLGGALYGVDLTLGPGQEEGSGLRPVMRVAAPIIQLRAVAPGTAVGYGQRWRATRPTRLAIVPVGYADGFTSHLAAGAWVLAGGERVAVVGAVSMDRITVDVTDLTVVEGDEVVLLGRQGERLLSAQQLARFTGDSVYEVLCRFGLRMPRRYLDEVPGSPTE